VIAVLSANNQGEGGTFALLALVKRSENVPKIIAIVSSTLSVCSAAFLFGDGALTPAISVLSAVQGLTIVM